MGRCKKCKYCKNCGKYEKINTKNVVCCDCGDEFQIDARNMKKIRCNKCQLKIDKLKTNERVKKYRKFHM